MVGSIDPYQLFRIFHELVGAMRDETDAVARTTAERVVYMLDQCHNIEPKIPAMIRSVMTLQETMARALLVDHEALRDGPGTRAMSSRRTGCCRTRSRPTSGRCSRELRTERGPAR